MTSHPDTHMSEEELAEAMGFTLKKSNKRNGFKVAPKYTRLTGAESEIIHAKTMADLADYIAERERLAEQRGERTGGIAAMRLMKHHAELHGLAEQEQYADHYLESVRQFPDQPTDSQHLDALGIEPQYQ